jgi:hypothetical protein
VREGGACALPWRAASALGPGVLQPWRAENAGAGRESGRAKGVRGRRANQRRAEASDKIKVKFFESKMPNCIYCGANDVTEEHPLPRGLGKFKGYVPLVDRLCNRCNGICGQLDEQLCRCGSEAFFRKFLGISGRPGHDAVNSFYRGSSRGKRLEMFGTNHETGEEKELELVGSNSVRELRCVKLIAEDDSTYTITITDGMTPEEFRKKVTALGIKFFKHAHISAAPEEIPWVESLFEGFKMEGKTQWVQPTGPNDNPGARELVTTRAFISTNLIPIVQRWAGWVHRA